MQVSTIILLIGLGLCIINIIIFVLKRKDTKTIELLNQAQASIIKAQTDLTKASVILNDSTKRLQDRINDNLNMLTDIQKDKIDSNNSSVNAALNAGFIKK
jgi:hypothetical protein